MGSTGRAVWAAPTGLSPGVGASLASTGHTAVVTQESPQWGHQATDAASCHDPGLLCQDDDSDLRLNRQASGTETGVSFLLPHILHLAISNLRTSSRSVQTTWKDFKSILPRKVSSSEFNMKDLKFNHCIDSCKQKTSQKLK